MWKRQQILYIEGRRLLNAGVEWRVSFEPHHNLESLEESIFLAQLQDSYLSGVAHDTYPGDRPLYRKGAY